ncbi:universal stress protein [Haloplanus halobius]|uniref:universal stress protein n=1 Tax=Haloplanus halobius TaxID=2934938 RepID=UPI00200F9D21|nr:universal stress protein [Haloplanus sp. XH21]
MYDTILIPTDGSKEARKAAEHGIQLAAAVGATVHALYVVKLPGAPRTVYIWEDEDEVREEYREYGEEVTAEVAEMAADAGVEAVTEITSGSVHEGIVDYADDIEADLIVMGTGYRGKVGGLLGTTAEKVVRTANVPVTTVRLSEVD